MWCLFSNSDFGGPRFVLKPAQQIGELSQALVRMARVPKDGNLLGKVRGHESGGSGKMKLYKFTNYKWANINAVSTFKKSVHSEACTQINVHDGGRDGSDHADRSA
jgi:hypothetical protein